MHRYLNHVRARLATGTLLALIGAAAAAGADTPPPSGTAKGLASSLALPMRAPVEAGSELLAARSKRDRASRRKPSAPPVVLSAARARLLLRSLTVPGWGQATVGHRTAATVFGLAEVGVWTSYTAFRVQERMRRDTYERTARLIAGIDLRGRDEEFRRIVGSYLSSDEYNLLVVSREAASLYYNDPAAFNAYVDAHSLKGLDAWAWPDDGALLRYRGQRKDSQRAALRANAALAVAAVNRLLSTIHAARLDPSRPSRSWELETVPDDRDPTAFRVQIRTRF